MHSFDHLHLASYYHDLWLSCISHYLPPSKHLRCIITWLITLKHSHFFISLLLKHWFVSAWVAIFLSAYLFISYFMIISPGPCHILSFHIKVCMPSLFQRQKYLQWTNHPASRLGPCQTNGATNRAPEPFQPANRGFHLKLKWFGKHSDLDVCLLLPAETTWSVEGQTTCKWWQDANAN